MSSSSSSSSSHFRAPSATVQQDSTHLLQSARWHHTRLPRRRWLPCQRRVRADATPAKRSSKHLGLDTSINKLVTESVFDPFDKYIRQNGFFSPSVSDFFLKKRSETTAEWKKTLRFTPFLYHSAPGGGSKQNSLLGIRRSGLASSSAAGGKLHMGRSHCLEPRFLLRCPIDIR